MKAFRNSILIIVLSMLTFFECQNSTTQIANVEKSVGFQLIEKQDYTRSVTGGNTPSTVHPRPIRTYIWYPARRSDDVQPMRFGHYAALADEDIWPAEIAGNFREELKYSHRPLARSLGPERFEELLQQPVLAIENAEALEGPFPLIVIGQGMYYGSPVTFAALSEYLAGRGFVVATCPFIGTNSPIGKLDAQDLETQVRDLEFVIEQARRFSFVSQDKLGVFGYDLGGMAGALLAMRNADVDAFLSVCSGLHWLHPCGLPMSCPDYDPLALRIPWLHSVPMRLFSQGTDTHAGSLFEKAIHSERYLLLTGGMDPNNYTSYALIEGRSEVKGYWATPNPEDAEDHKAVRRYISAFFNTFLTNDTKCLAILSQDPKKYNPDSTWSLEHRPAVPASITYEEFVQAVVAGRAEEAIGEVRALQETHPDHILLNDEYLRRLSHSFLNNYGLTEEVMPVIKFTAEMYPMSASAQLMLAEGYIDVGDYPAAIEVYNRLLERYPGVSYYKSRLEWLRSQ